MTIKNPPAIRNSFPWQRQETQLSLTNRLTHLCSVQWRGWPHKTRPSPCVLRHRILSFYVKYRRTPKWGTLEFWPLRKGCGWPPRTSPSLYVLPRRIRSFWIKGCRHIWEAPIKLGSDWVRFLIMGCVADPLKTSPSDVLPCVTSVIVLVYQLGLS